MKPFRFRAERILEWRRSQAEAARGEFARASESAHEALQAADAADARSAQASSAALVAMRSAVDVETLERHRNWITRECRHADQFRRVHQQRQRTADEKALALQQAKRHLRVMERLRERAERRYRDLERKQDLKTLNELATLQFARRRADEGVERDN